MRWLESEITALMISSIENFSLRKTLLTWILSVALLERPIGFITPLDELANLSASVIRRQCCKD